MLHSIYAFEVEITKSITAYIGKVGAQGALQGGGNQLHFIIDTIERNSTFKLISGKPIK